MAILGGNAKPKPEQMSKLVMEEIGLQSHEVEDESLLGNFLQEFSIKNIYIYIYIFFFWLCWVLVAVFRIFIVACGIGIFLVVAGRLLVTACSI